MASNKRSVGEEERDDSAGGDFGRKRYKKSENPVYNPETGRGGKILLWAIGAGLVLTVTALILRLYVL